MMKKLLLVLAAFLVVCFGANLASATDLDVLSYDPWTTVAIDITEGTTHNYSEATGKFTFAVGASNTQMTGYCIEIKETINVTSYDNNYTLTPITAASADYAKMEAFIVSQGYTGAMAAAAQIAVWELQFDYAAFGFNLNANNVIFAADSNGVLVSDVNAIYTAASTFIATPGNFPSGEYYFATNVGQQDFVMGKVPLPGAVMLLGAGLVRLVAYARRRQED
jgi:hypothetical protein